MHSALPPLQTILTLNTRLFINCLSDVSDEIARRIVAERTSTMLFIAHHCLDARIFMAETAGISLAHPFPEIAEAERAEDVCFYPPVPEVLVRWTEISPDFIRSLGALSQEELQAPSTKRFPVHDLSVLGALSFLVQHESYHIGQLSLLRRLHGLSAMSYGERSPRA